MNIIISLIITFLLMFVSSKVYGENINLIESAVLAFIILIYIENRNFRTK